MPQVLPTPQAPITIPGIPDVAVPLAIRGGLTLAVLIVALVVAHWLGELASRVPVSVEGEAGQDGRYVGSLVRMAKRGAGHWLGRVTRLSVWFAALVAIAVIWLWDVVIPAQKEITSLTSGLGDLAVRIGGTLLVVALALGLGRRLQQSVAESLKRGTVNANLALLVGRIVYIATLALGAVVILAIWGTGIVFPVALLGALTVALSLALQDVLKNLVAGIYLLLERPFVIGDYITLNPYSGVVEDIQIRYTALRTAEGQRVLVPNQLLFSSPVVNQSFYQQRRAVLSLALPDIGPDGIESANAEIRGALAGLPGILQQPAPQVVLSGASNGKLELRVVVWLSSSDVGALAGVVSQTIERLRAALPMAEVTAVEPAVGASV